MLKISQKQQRILGILLKQETLGSSGLHGQLLKTGDKISQVTVKRELSRMAADGLVMAIGNGRSRVYRISALGRLQSDVDAAAYCRGEPDQRYGLSRFNFDLLPAFPKELLGEEELGRLQSATAAYRKRTADVPPAIAKKELERLIVELSWKSSKIEGNTYTLLDTEKLILEHKEAPGHDKQEAVMILNHKDAFTFVREHKKEFRSLTRANLEALHRILVKDMRVGFGLRQKPVGVLGSKYQPLDNAYQIREAVDVLATAVANQKPPYGKAFVALLGISYIQPFEDGNKRTARLMANALLLAYDCAPLSYRSVDEQSYREATLAFYELNSLVPFKNIFIEQYEFSTRNYVAK